MKIVSVHWMMIFIHYGQFSVLDKHTQVCIYLTLIVAKIYLPK